MCGRYVSADEGAMQRAWHVSRQNRNPFIRNISVAPACGTGFAPIDHAFDNLEENAGSWAECRA